MTPSLAKDSDAFCLQNAKQIKFIIYYISPFLVDKETFCSI